MLWLGPVPLRAYALCILAGIVVATMITARRLKARGENPEAATNVALWAVPFGIVGGRIYHVITTPQPYFGAGGRPLNAFKIWEGGLGIWGAVLLGALGAYFGCRKEGVRFGTFADALAPALPVAQAMGRFGNYFNNELYGARTDVPWALQIHQWDQAAGKAVTGSNGEPIVLGYFHPTFLYEALWCLLIGAIIWQVSDRGFLRRGQAFALYVMLYPVGRIVVEMMRSDFANRIMGLRVNVWVCIAVFLLGLALFLAFRRKERDSLHTRFTADSHNSPDQADVTTPSGSRAKE